LVDDPPFGWSSLNTEKLRALEAQGKGAETIAHNLSAKRMPQIYPDNRLEVALRHVGQWPFLPVIHRADPRQLVGLVSMRDVMGAASKRLPTILPMRTVARKSASICNTSRCCSAKAISMLPC